MKPDYTLLKNLADDKARYLPAEPGGQAASWHLWRPGEINAITLALAAQRPLLVLGEPGSGKSQLARAAKVALGWQLSVATLHARSEVEDLLYRFDAIRRLADAQVPGKLKEDRDYWEPQALWLAFDWFGAHDFGSLRERRNPDGSKPAAPAGQVLLFDEIDKAPADVPNGLLDVLGERRFDLPALGLQVAAGRRDNGQSDKQNGDQSGGQSGGQATPWPLIIFTSNGEKDLPDAFKRRCVVLSHAPEREEGYQAFLERHGLAHFAPGRPEGRTLDPQLMAAAARQLAQDRQQAKLAGVYRPGLAEYLDLLYALDELAPGDTDAQWDWLVRLNQFAYLKSEPDEQAPDALRQDPAGVRPLAQSGTQSS